MELNRAFVFVAGLVAAMSERSAPHAECVERAAAGFGISPLPIEVLLAVEGGRAGHCTKNENGTCDMGPMQINTIWVPHFAKLGITRDELLNNACVNIFAGTYILVTHYARTGNMADAMAAYHSRTPKHADRYLGQIQRALQRRIASARAAAPSPSAGSDQHVASVALR